ncbi:cobalamin B12-binding domain-containing protein [Ekhidna sp.]|uniref:cobalamin B12-binding domain-containing protein n=1 Tax=Ekhidna sp. TaxID=2608089 RepID=UPI003B511C7C
MTGKKSAEIVQFIKEKHPEWKPFENQLSSTIELLSCFSSSDDDFSKFLRWQDTFLSIINLSKDQFKALCRSFYNELEESDTSKRKLKVFLDGGLSDYAISLNNNQDISKAIVEFHSELFGEIDQYLIAKDIATITSDTNQHIAFLSQAIDAGSKVLFNEYVSWFQSTLNAQEIGTQSVIRFLVTIRMFHEANENALPYIDNSILKLIDGTDDKPEENTAYLNSEVSKKYLDFLLDGDRRGATEFIMKLADDGYSLKEIYIDVFQSSQYEIGRLWEKNKVSVAQEHYCTATTQMIMSMLYPRLFSSKSIGKTVIATCVGNELHEIGIRMISDFMEMDGWDTYYLGANTPTNAIIESIEKYNADLLALSVTLTPHVSNASEIIREVKRVHPSIKVIVGGYPFLQDEALWVRIGADGLAKSANEVNETALAILNG